VGETNQLTLRGRGVFVCISPWNFPLAIFTGQIAAALAAGNAVLAKPAEQTPLIAAEAVRLFTEAGLDPRLVSLLPGRGETVGAALVAHPGIDGVAFTGGTETAWRINQALAAKRGPIVPFIAETGGLNGMFVDTTALREQVIDDVIVSAFGSRASGAAAPACCSSPRHRRHADRGACRAPWTRSSSATPPTPRPTSAPSSTRTPAQALNAHLDRLRREAKVIKQLDPGPGPNAASTSARCWPRSPTPTSWSRRCSAPSSTSSATTPSACPRSPAASPPATTA
jgi:RHH-type proline utilization regulon transcriptional repressor/proline dehydrogenase/delta 1-pyrroline-5-carboxylate dehydrogenase